MNSSRQVSGKRLPEIIDLHPVGVGLDQLRDVLPKWFTVQVKLTNKVIQWNLKQITPCCPVLSWIIDHCSRQITAHDQILLMTDYYWPKILLMTNHYSWPIATHDQSLLMTELTIANSSWPKILAMANYYSWPNTNQFIISNTSRHVYVSWAYCIILYCLELVWINLNLNLLIPNYYSKTNTIHDQMLFMTKYYSWPNVTHDQSLLMRDYHREMKPGQSLKILSRTVHSEIGPQNKDRHRQNPR